MFSLKYLGPNPSITIMQTNFFTHEHGYSFQWECSHWQKSSRDLSIGRTETCVKWWHFPQILSFCMFSTHDLSFFCHVKLFLGEPVEVGDCKFVLAYWKKMGYSCKNVVCKTCKITLLSHLSTQFPLEPIILGIILQEDYKSNKERIQRWANQIIKSLEDITVDAEDVAWKEFA